LESLKKEIAMLTSLLEHALGYKSGEATFTTQSPQMSTTPFNPQNLRVNEVLSEFQ
jgi:hypothetical protein